MRPLRRDPAESSRMRVRAFQLRFFGKLAGVSPSPASFPPNKSFKPTPCRGFVETSRHAGNTGSHPPRSARLNSGVRRQKKHSFSAAICSLIRSAHFRSVAVFSCCAYSVRQSYSASDSSSGALKVHKRCVRPLRKQRLVRSVFRD